MSSHATPGTGQGHATTPTLCAVRDRLPGVGAAAAVAGVGSAVGLFLPLLGAPVAAIVIGVAASQVLRGRRSLRPGLAFSAQVVLPLAVVVLGSQLSLGQVAQVGVSSLPVMLGTLTACLVVAAVLGRTLRLDADLITLIGVGTAICGASAIAAVSPVIKARSHVVAYAISTIFFFNVAAVLVFPPLGHALGLTQGQFGLFAGTAVNDTSSVVAAATTYGAAATDHAVVVKLTRTLMIIPICLALGAIGSRRRRRVAGSNTATDRPATPGIPVFLVGFLAVACLNTVGAVPSALHVPLREASTLLITVALAAIGLSTDLGALRRTGLKPWLLGAVLWGVVASTSLVLQWAT